MHRTYECDTKARISFSGGPYNAPVNMADSMEEVNVRCRKCYIICAVLQCYISYAKFSEIVEVLQNFHRHSDPETVQLPAFSILSRTKIRGQTETKIGP